MGLFGLWLVLVGSSCLSAEVATPTLPTLRADLLRAQELVRLTGKARQALTLPELLDALRSLDLIKLHVFNTSVALDVTTLRKDTLGEVESLELLAKRLVETLQVSVDEAERLKSMVNRSQHLTYLTSRTGPCRKRSRASTWLAQLRPKLPKRLEEVNSLQRLLQTMNQHVKRIREEALMGDVALNASVKLHEEAAEHAQKARHEYDSALKALTRVNRLVKDQIFTLEVESPETPEVHQRVHNGSHWASLMQIDDVPLATPGYQKDQKGAKKSTPCEHEAPPRHTLGTADSKLVPVAAQHPLPPTGPPVTSTTAASVVTTTQSTSAKVAESDPSPDMPRIFIPGTREPEMEKIHTPSTTVTSTTSTTSHIPSPTPRSTPPPSTSVTTDHLEYVMDETLEALMTERHRLIKVILNINRDIVRADNRSAGLLKARLVAEDAAVQLRRADENHGKAVALVERQLNATQQKMQSLRGQIRIFTAAVKRLSGCLDPEEKEKRQPFLQQLKEESRKIAEEEETLQGLADHALVMWNKVESRNGRTYNLDCRPHADPYRISPAKDISCEQAWPRGTLVHYKSEQREKQGGVQPPLPAVVKSFNESDQTYNLDIRDHADCDRIRIRVITREGGPSSEPGITSAMPRHAQVMEKRVTRHFNGTEAAKLNEDAIRTESDAAAPETPAETKRIGEGFWCHVPEHDLRARVLSVRGGVAELEIGGASTEKKLELLRAPKDNKEMAWPKGTQVMYHSVTGGGRWIEAHIEQFNPHNGTYNLDVRPEADADKVRPR